MESGVDSRQVAAESKQWRSRRWPEWLGDGPGTDDYLLHGGHQDNGRIANRGRGRELTPMTALEHRALRA